MIAFLKRWLRKESLPEKPPSIIQQAIRDLDLVNPYALKHVYSSDLSIFILKVPVSTVGQYISLLERATNIIETDTGAFKTEYIFEFKDIYIDDFFITTNGYYLDNVIEIVIRLINVIRLFLIAYEKIIDVDFQYPIKYHNRKVLTNLVMNSIDIVNVLVKIK